MKENTTKSFFNHISLPMIIGKEPIKRATVVNPNDRPLFLGITLNIAISVTGIVKLKTKPPKMPKNGIVDSKESNGIEINKLPTPTFTNPYLSVKIPPKTFPRANAAIKIKYRYWFSFHGNSIDNPIRERTVIGIIINAIINIL